MEKNTKPLQKLNSDEQKKQIKKISDELKPIEKEIDKLLSIYKKGYVDAVHKQIDALFDKVKNLSEQEIALRKHLDSSNQDALSELAKRINNSLLDMSLVLIDDIKVQDERIKVNEKIIKKMG